MKIYIETTLKANIETVWRYVLLPKTLLFIAKPLLRFVPVKPNKFPENWEVGQYETLIKSLGFIPFGSHFIVIEIPENQTENQKKLIDNGYGKIISRWYHIITIERIDDNKIKYADEVEIRAGLLTPFIWLFAFGFYHWRQRRWKKLIQNDFKNL